MQKLPFFLRLWIYDMKSVDNWVVKIISNLTGNAELNKEIQI